MKHFCLKHFSDCLPISKSRRQLSLDSSQTLSNGQWLPPYLIGIAAYSASLRFTPSRPSANFASSRWTSLQNMPTGMIAKRHAKTSKMSHARDSFARQLLRDQTALPLKC